MTVQYIKTEDGKRLAVMPEEEYAALLEKLEDMEDLAAVREIDAKLASGEEERIPAEFVNCMIDGENKIRMWREYRGMSVKALAEDSGLTAAYVSQIETGVHEGTVETFKKIAAALRLSIDDIV